MPLPTTREDLQRASTAAAILLALEDAEAFDLIPANPLNVNRANAIEMIALGNHNGIAPLVPHDHLGSIVDADGPVLPLPPPP